MSLESWFRVSAYLTLGLSCGALVFAEAPFLPDLQICLAPVLTLLLLGWWVEGRWSLPNRGADLLGLLIVGAGGFWLWKHRSDDDFVLTQLPWQLAMFPYMGPLLMAALLVKVFRRRDPYHFWHLQLLGLTQIGLGCILDGGPAFGAAVAAYLASALTCLALHYRLSARGGVRGQGSGVSKEQSPFSLTPVPWSLTPPRWLLAFTPRWLLLIAGPALLLFLLTPRRDNWAWEPLNNFGSGYNRIRVQGGSEEMNLNNTGRLELDDEIALQVTATDADGRPKQDLAIDQRWRSTVLEDYERGTWSVAQLDVGDWRPRIPQVELPNFGHEQFFLTFSVLPRRAGGLVVAEPVRLGPSRAARLPVLALDEEGQQRLFTEHWGALSPVELRDKRREYHYRQVVVTGRDPTRTPAVGIHMEMGKAGPLLTGLPRQLRLDLQAWTGELLLRLSKQPQYRVPQGVLNTLEKAPKNLVVGEDEREATARLLTDYLSRSGDFTYTLELTRQDRSIDPVLDFLINVKQGHCERYAGALAAILRAIDIPARIVKGFRGWGSKGDGLYIIRHRHAHAWVEILVRGRPLPQRLSFLGQPLYSYDWLTLDPTPSESIPASSGLSLSTLWQQAQQFCIQTWRSLIIEYNGEEQADLWDALTAGKPPPALLKLGLVVAAFGVVIAAWLLVRRLRRRRRTADLRVNGSGSGFYPRLVRLLERHASLRPTIGQTPREYGESARNVLQARPAWATVAQWPLRVIELFYRVRFGERPMREEERQVLESEFERFAATLRQPRP